MHEAHTYVHSEGRCDGFSEVDTAAASEVRRVDDRLLLALHGAGQPVERHSSQPVPNGRCKAVFFWSITLNVNPLLHGRKWRAYLWQSVSSGI